MSQGSLHAAAMDNESHSRAAAPLPRPRRVFTAPASSIQPTTRIQDISDTQDVETLYVHPNAKIISFSTPYKDFGPEEDVSRAEAGTLPWSNRLERTIGVGESPQLILHMHWPRS